MTKKETLQSTFKLVDLDLIIEPEGNVRMAIPERTLFELSESMKEVGLLQPIILTPNKDKLEVVAGQRRWLAAKRLKWKTIRAEVRKLTRVQIALIRATENLQKEGLTSIEEGAVYADLFDQHKLTMKMIADRMGKSVHHVKRMMDLLRMDPEVQKAVHHGKISNAVAFELNKIGEKKDLYRYLELAVENGVTSTVAAQWTEEYRKGLQYLNDRSLEPSPIADKTKEEKYYTMCQTCEGPMEYKDMRVIKICAKCNDLIIKVVQQGYFKNGGK
jgi:ParB/RepB/Spo0J family partition protein